MKKKVIVLGKNGMLGSMVLHYLANKKDYIIYSTARDRRGAKSKNKYYFEVNEFLNNQKVFSYLNRFDFIINCIGVTKPYIRDDNKKEVINAIIINTRFPHFLASYVKKTRVIHIGTDCVFSGKRGKYKESDSHDAEDVYGKTKSLGEIFYSNNFLNIRCSIVGPEKKGHLNLLGWFLNNRKGSKVKGYAHHKWNGATTLQYAKLCSLIIKGNNFSKIRKINHTHHFIPNNPVTKYQLLKIINNIYERDIKLVKVKDIGNPIDKTLSTNYTALSKLYGTSTIRKAIEEMKNYVINSNNF